VVSLPRICTERVIKKILQIVNHVPKEATSGSCTVESIASISNQEQNPYRNLRQQDYCSGGLRRKCRQAGKLLKWEIRQGEDN